MKKNFLKICVLLMGVSLVSCLDDSKYALDPGNAENVIEFYDPSVPNSPAGAVYPVWTATTEVAPDFTLEQIISYSGPDGNNKDIELTLAVDPTALDEYNTQMTAGINGDAPLGGSTYDLLPEANYDLDQTTITIPKGEKKVTMSISVFPNLFDLSKNYVIPVRITSSSHGTLSAHYSVALLAVVVKNKYDGIYEIKGGSIFRNLGGTPDAVLGGNYPTTGLSMPLITINGNTVGISPVWKDGSPVGGIAGTQLSVNEATNAVTVTSSNVTLHNTPATTSTYDPATKTFTLNFEWGAAPNDRRITGLILEFVEPRP